MAASIPVVLADEHFLISEVKLQVSTQTQHKSHAHNDENQALSQRKLMSTNTNKDKRQHPSPKVVNKVEHRKAEFRVQGPKFLLNTPWPFKSTS